MDKRNKGKPRESSWQERAGEGRKQGDGNRRGEGKRASKRKFIDEVEEGKEEEVVEVEPLVQLDGLPPIRVAKPGRRREPEVVVFSDPSARAESSSMSAGMEQYFKAERKRFMSEKISKIREPVAPTALLQKRDPEDPESLENLFLSMASDVAAFGAKNLDKRTRKQFELKRLQSLGAKAPKPPKAPLKVLIGMKSKEKEREVRRREEEKIMGIFKKEKREKKDAKGFSTGSRWVDRSDITDKRFKNGVLRVDKPVAK